METQRPNPAPQPRRVRSPRCFPSRPLTPPRRPKRSRHRVVFPCTVGLFTVSSPERAPPPIVRRPPWSPRGVLSRHVDRVLVTGFRPRLAREHVLDIDIAFFDQAGLGVDDAILLPLGLHRLAFQNDHPDVTVFEVAAPLHGSKQLLIVQVTFAEIPTEQRTGDDFAVT